MTNNVQGAVEVIYKNKSNYHNIKIGNDWYGVGRDYPACKDGDTVSFSYEQNGNFKNADMNTFKVVGASAGGQVNNTPSSSPAVGDRQLSIVYQHSQEMALRAVDILLQHDGLPLPAKKADKYEAILAAYDDLANDFCRKALNPVLPEVGGSGEATDVSDEF